MGGITLDVQTSVNQQLIDVFIPPTESQEALIRKLLDGNFGNGNFRNSTFLGGVLPNMVWVSPEICRRILKGRVPLSHFHPFSSLRAIDIPWNFTRPMEGKSKCINNIQYDETCPVTIFQKGESLNSTAGKGIGFFWLRLWEPNLTLVEHSPREDPQDASHVRRCFMKLHERISDLMQYGNWGVDYELATGESLQSTLTCSLFIYSFIGNLIGMDSGDKWNPFSCFSSA